MIEVHRFEKVVKSGWSLNMHVVPLPDGGTLVYSPTWLGDETFERIEAHEAFRVPRREAPVHWNPGAEHVRGCWRTCR